MARKRQISQISNLNTYLMYKRQFLALAENVFVFENVPKYIDMSYVNEMLVSRGSIAFFVDEFLGLIALPYKTIGKLDVYGRPNKIKCYGQNGYNSRILNPSEYVIMYDNWAKYPLYLDIIQYATRIAADTRTSDINIAQQKTPRIFKCKNGMELSVKNTINSIDAFENEVLTYDSIDLDDISVILSPAPFVADKIDQHKEKEFAEFLRLIGISTVNSNKAERLIRDEVTYQNGGTVASRFNRYEPRRKALKEIFDKFKIKIEVSFYDGLPTTLQEFVDNTSLGGDEDVQSNADRQSDASTDSI